MLNYFIFSLRRDKLSILLWLILIVGLTAVVAPLIGELFETKVDRLLMAETMKNPAMIALCGPSYDYENYTDGAMMGQMMLVWTSAIAAAMNIFFVTRHTRKDEEDGRLELMCSLPISKNTPIISTLLLALVINVALAILTGASIAAFEVESMDIVGSMLFGACLGAVGLVFAGITAFLAQIFQTSRGTLGASFGILGIAYLLRAVGDVGSDGASEALSLISPLGLVCRTEVFVNDYWWPIAVTIAVATALSLLAFLLSSGRDHGQGLLSARTGRRYGSPLLRSPLALTIKLLRNQIVAWFLALLAVGAMYGSIFSDIELFTESSEMMKALLVMDSELDLNDQFVTTLMMIMSLFTAAAGLTFVYKVKSEEKRGHLEFILSNAVSRPKLLLGYAVTAIVSCTVIQLTMALAMWGAADYVMENPIALEVFLGSALVYLPAILCFIGLGTLLVGLSTKYTGLGWIYLGYTLFAVYLGRLINIPEWLVEWTPIGATPQVPVEDMAYGSVSAMVIISILSISIGVKTFKLHP